VAALVGLGGSVVAWFGARPASPLDLSTSTTDVVVSTRRTP
jgi:uncharacterized membrane protein